MTFVLARILIVIGLLASGSVIACPQVPAAKAAVQACCCAVSCGCAAPCSAEEAPAHQPVDDQVPATVPVVETGLVPPVLVTGRVGFGESMNWPGITGDSCLSLAAVSRSTLGIWRH
ncbi:hypothetical protein [Mucisphaera sp.]|uniref:hypothetical protein n=1 Tax=Mucisphaera sp. TaxID=2913024 RepID=UPI003D13F354